MRREATQGQGNHTKRAIFSQKTPCLALSAVAHWVGGLIFGRLFLQVTAWSGFARGELFN
jgi:hypothetical protein